MTQQQDDTFRRRPDGSVDITFYARRAALLRSAALREEPARWIRGLLGLVAKYAIGRPVRATMGSTDAARPG